MKVTYLFCLMFMLTGCDSWLESPEKAAKDAKICREAGLKIAMNGFGKVICQVNKE